MNYLKIYNKIIDNARLEKRKKKCGIYYERHHIIPKCQGGNNRKDNLVLLTAREHYICHKLLQKAYPMDRKIFFAYQSMMTRMTGDRKKVSAREYEIAKHKLSIIDEVYYKTHKGNRLGQRNSEESIEKYKKSMRIYYDSMTPEERKNLKGTFKSGKDNVGYGIPRTQEVKNKISESQSSRIIFDGTFYKNIKECAKILNKNEKAIKSKLYREIDKENPKYEILDKNLKHKPNIKNNKRILFNGVEYESLVLAGKAIGRTANRVGQIMNEKIKQNDPLYKFL